MGILGFGDDEETDITINNENAMDTHNGVQCMLMCNGAIGRLIYAVRRWCRRTKNRNRDLENQVIELSKTVKKHDK